MKTDKIIEEIERIMRECTREILTKGKDAPLIRRAIFRNKSLEVLELLDEVVEEVIGKGTPITPTEQIEIMHEQRERYRKLREGK